MATTYYSEERDAYVAVPSRLSSESNYARVVKVKRTVKTSTGGKFTTATDVARLFKVPAGWKLLNHISKVYWEDVGTTGTLHVGHLIGAGDEDAFLQSEDIASAAGSATLDLGGTLHETEFTSEAWLTATLATANTITDAKTISFYLYFAAP